MDAGIKKGPINQMDQNQWLLVHFIWNLCLDVIKLYFELKVMCFQKTYFPKSGIADMNSDVRSQVQYTIATGKYDG